MSRIFISHSSKDNFEAIAVRDWLAEEGWNDVFLDLDPERGIKAGERWERALHEAANRCEAVVFLVSANWLASGWCLKEYSLARGLNKKLFAAIVDPGKTIADLPPELAGTWQAVSLTGGQDSRVFRAALAGSHEEKHVAFSSDGLRRLKNGLEKAGLDPKFFAWPPEAEKDRAPYRGLKPLEGVDAGIFFGRDAPVVEATDELRGLRKGVAPRLLVVLGASGAGKSSFLRAGLLPRLARDDANFLPLPAIRPERAALSGESGLLGALEKVFPTRARAELRATISAGAAGVRPLLAELVDAAFKRTLAAEANAEPPTIVIAIDQAEELFRGDGAEEGAAFLALLRDLVRGDAPAVIALFAIRSDAYDDLERAEPFEDLPQRTLPLLPMPRGAFKEVIEGPARRLGEAGGKLAIEPRLTQALLEDLERGGGSDALPLLAFTLEQLYLEYGRTGALRLDDYRAFGGLRGAIDKAVERAFARADADARIPRDRRARETLLRRGLIPWLAGVDPDTRSPRRNIARRADIPGESEPLIDLLVEERLLSTDVAKDTGEVTIEPAHEALLRQWGLLKGWLAEDFGRLATLEGVERGARDWDANGRAPAWLAHQGQRLADAQTLDERPDIAAQLDPTARAYLAQCRVKEEAARAQEETRRREREEEQARRLADAEAIAAANKRATQRTRIGLFVALILAAAAAWQWRAATAQKQFAETQRDRAERALTTATNTADALVFDLAQKFRNVVGAPAETIADILDRARKLQDELLSGGETNPALLRSQMTAFGERARSLLAVGDTSGALAAAEKSVAIARKLAEDKSNAEAQRDLSISLERIGNVKVRVGDAAKALEAHGESLALRRKLAEDKSDVQAQRDLAVSLGKIGDVKLRAGDAAGALEAYEESLTLRRKLAEDKSDVQAQHGLALSLGKIGNVKLRAGDAAGALEAYEESLGIARKLAEDKSDVQAQHGLALSLGKIGNVKLRAGDAAGALEAYEESLVLRRKLAEDKSNAEAQHGLAVSLGNIGDVKLRAGDAAGALEAYEESLGIARKLADDKSNAEAQGFLAVSLGRIGDVKLRAGDAAGALEVYEESLGIFRKLAEDKSNAEAQRDLSVGDARVADALVKLGRLKEALSYDEDSLAISEMLAKRDDRNEPAQGALAIASKRVGDDLRKLGRPTDAFTYEEQALAIHVKLAAAHPNDNSARDDVEKSADEMGNLAYELLFAHNFARSLDASDRAIAAAPGLVRLHTNRAHALMLLGRVDEARNLYRAHRGEKTEGDKIWEPVIREDFVELRKAGLTYPLMGEIERLFAGRR